jgi:hypothetical protein
MQAQRAGRARTHHAQRVVRIRVRVAVVHGAAAQRRGLIVCGGVALLQAARGRCGERRCSGRSGGQLHHLGIGTHAARPQRLARRGARGERVQRGAHARRNTRRVTTRIRISSRLHVLLASRYVRLCHVTISTQQQQPRRVRAMLRRGGDGADAGAAGRRNAAPRQRCRRARVRER